MESKDLKTKKKKIKFIEVRAVKFRLYNPETKKSMTLKQGDQIKPVWPELVKLAENDKGRKSLAIIYETD
jgi:hypothetical protein